MVTAKYVRPGSGYHACEDLEVGHEYEVGIISMGQSSTYFTIVNMSGYYNSVQFDFFENGRPLDIYSDGRFNPYIKLFKEV